MGIEGTWYNELGSQMEIKLTDNVMSGTYTSKVGDAAGPYKMSGFVDPKPSPGGQSVGWVVSWSNDQKNAHSVTAWSGEYQVVELDGKNEEVITTEWLLTIETDQSDDWQSTLVGHDLFRRTAPLKENILRRSKTRAWSHPT